MTNVADIQIRASLIDDYLQIEDAPVAANLGGRFVAIQDPATPQACSLATIDPEGNLVHFLPDPTSHSGWSLATVPVTPPAGSSGAPNRLAAYSQGGVINLLAYFPAQAGSGSAAVWMQFPPEGIWSEAPLAHDAANALGYTYQTDTYVDAQGNQYLYGVTGNISPGAFFLVTYDSTGKCWDVVYEQLLNRFTPVLSTAATFRLMPGNGGDDLTLVWIDAGVLYYQGASLSSGSFQWMGSGPGQVQLAQGLAVRQIIPMPGYAAANSLLIIDQNDALWLVAGYADTAPTVTPLSGGSGRPAGVTSSAVGVADSGMLMVFAIETTSQALWILRQSGTSTAGLPEFGFWVQLGNTVGAIACPSDMRGNAAECFTVDLGQTLYHFAQTASDLVWASRQVAAPTPSTAAPQNIAATTMSLTVLDAQQAPVGGAVVTVTSDQPTTVVMTDLAYQIGPNAPATVQADPTGSLTAAIATSSLTSPIVTFSVTNADGTGAQRWCQGDVVEVKTGETALPPCAQSIASRLANQDPTQPLTAASLQSAGLISGSYSDPAGAALSIVSAGQWMLQNPQSVANSIDLGRVQTRHWRIDFTDPAGPRFAVLSEEDARTLLAAAGPPATALGSGSGFLGDVLNFFKHLWNDLKSIVATVVDDVLHLIVNGVTYVVDSLRQAADALETVLNRIIQGLKDVWQAIVDVVDWLKQLFDWGDILTTHQVIKACVNSLLTTAVDRVDDLEGLVQEKFASLETKIKAGFANIEQAFEPGQTFNQFANAQKANAAGGSGDFLAGAPASTAYGQHGPRCNYIHAKAKTYFSGSAAAVALGSTTGSGGTDAITSLVSQNWAGSAFNKQTQALQDFVTGKISNPHDFFNLVIVDFLVLVEDAILLILDALEEIILAVLKAVAAAIQGLQKIWDATIDIPIISWLYKYVITGSKSKPGDDLSLLDLLSLVIAVPATILYKVLFGGSAPFEAADPAVQQVIGSGLPWPAVPTAWSSASLRAGLESASSSIPPSLVSVMGAVAGVAAFFGTFINMGNDGLAMAEEPVPGLAKFLSWASVIQGVASQAFAAPWSVFGQEASVWSTADGWTTALWAVSAVPLAYDSIFSLATEALARYAELGPLLDTGAGFALIGIALATLMEQVEQGSPYTGWDAANSLVPQVDRLFKFLILTKNEPETEVVTLPLLLVVDLVLGIGATVTQVGAAVVG